MQTMHHVICGDSRQMGEVAAQSVQLIVTSPPYWQLKDYGAAGQIGYDEPYEEYINHLNLVWGECYRALADGCRLCVNIGDQFARAVTYGRYKVIPIRAEIIKFCEAVGFDYMGAIIWQKKMTTNTTGGASLMGSYPMPRNGILSIDYEFILLFKKLGNAPKPGAAARAMSRMSKEEWKTYFSGHWNFAGARQDTHLAAFPEELPRRLIRMFSFVGDTVLDPFAGSGTTLLAAKNLGRNSVGYELNDAFIPLIRQKIGAEREERGTDYRFTRQPQRRHDFAARIGALPYRFRDFHALDRKTDPKQLRVGSKIDSTSPAAREDYHAVKEIVSPSLIRIESGLSVRLIGVRDDDATRERAMRFLRDKTHRQKVYLRFDSDKHDEDNNLLAYLYLANKTFLNAHLLKNGLANVDLRRDYRNKARFIRYRREAN